MQLLLTKLNVPPYRSQWIARQRLLDRLALQPETALVLVSAPAGFGKTTLLSSWCHALALDNYGRPGIGWVSLDEGDNDPARFLAYLFEAISRAAGGAVDTRPAGDLLSQPAPGGGVDRSLEFAINALEQGGTELLVVLDDYHLISSPAVHTAVAYLIEHRPTGLHLAIGSRARPPLPLARLRARSQLIELRATDLRFTGEEAARFLAQTVGEELPSAQTEALLQRCEGWVAGLQLAALSLQDREERPQKIEGFTGRQSIVLDYLMEEVFTRQTEEVQSFLLRTAILERLSGPLCDAVSENRESRVENRDSRADHRESIIVADSRLSTLDSRFTTPDSRSILESLERNNLFTLALDMEGQWFRYHPLFADMLLERLRRTMREAIPGLHARAAEWFGEHGFAPEAVKHYLAVPDADGAAAMMADHMGELLAAGENVTVLAWLDALPTELLNGHSSLVAAKAWLLAMAGKADDVERLLDEAGAGADGLVEQLPAEIAVVWAFLSLSQRIPDPTIRLSQQALNGLPENALFWRGIAARTLGEAYLWAGNLEAGGDAIAQSSAISLAAGNLSLGFSALNNLASLFAQQGQLTRAAETYRTALEEATEKGWQRHPYAAVLYAGNSGILVEWDRLDEAEAQMAEALEIDGRGQVRDVRPVLLLGLAKLRAAQQRFPEAFQAVDAVEAAFSAQIPPGMGSPFRALKAWYALLAGDWPQAEAWALTVNLPESGEATGQPGQDDLILALVLAAKGLRTYDVDLLTRTAGLLEPALTAMQATGIVAGQILIGAALAAIDIGLGETERAVKALGVALDLAAPEGFTRTFLDLGLPLAGALDALIHREPDTPRARYAARLRASAGPPMLKPVTPPQPGYPERLSERELEILSLVARGASNQEIADRLVISVATVKSHVNHIMGKLSAQNRTEAVAIARELGWLYPTKVG